MLSLTREVPACLPRLSVRVALGGPVRGCRIGARRDPLSWPDLRERGTRERPVRRSRHPPAAHQKRSSTAPATSVNTSNISFLPASCATANPHGNAIPRLSKLGYYRLVIYQPTNASRRSRPSSRSLHNLGCGPSGTRLSGRRSTRRVDPSSPRGTGAGLEADRGQGAERSPGDP